MCLEGEGISAQVRACFDKARRIGEQGGYFVLESESCLGLMELEKREGRFAQALQHQQQAVIAADLMQDDDPDKVVFQANALQSVIEDSSRDSPNFDDALLHRYRELAERVDNSPGRQRGWGGITHRTEALIYLVLNPQP